MTDSHCHLDHCDDPEAAADPELRAIVTVGTSAERNLLTVQLAERIPNVFAAVGIHPNNASDAADPELRSEVETLLRHDLVVAVGETGFDTHWERETLATQTENFSWQADAARRFDRALIVHVRDRQGSDHASRAAARNIVAAGHRRGVLHCFNGDPHLLEVGLDMGWMVSFAGNLTYRNASDLHRAATLVPSDRLLVETDSPFLTPVPLRGKRNRPANVRFTAARLAELRGVDAGELEAQLDRNAEHLYRFGALLPPGA